MHRKAAVRLLNKDTRPRLPGAAGAAASARNCVRFT
jgi:hypothetical protein